jgi:nuclear transcription factor Y gamma
MGLPGLARKRLGISVLNGNFGLCLQMIAAEAPVLFAKACEMFILELTLCSWIHTEENKWWTLQRNDIAGAITRGDIFYFLVDIVPRDKLKVRVYTAFGIFSSTISMSDFPCRYSSMGQTKVRVYKAFGIFSSTISMWHFPCRHSFYGINSRLEFTQLLVFFLVQYPSSYPCPKLIMMVRVPGDSCIA